MGSTARLKALHKLTIFCSLDGRVGIGRATTSTKTSSTAICDTWKHEHITIPPAPAAAAWTYTALVAVAACTRRVLQLFSLYKNRRTDLTCDTITLRHDTVLPAPAAAAWSKPAPVAAVNRSGPALKPSPTRRQSPRSTKPPWWPRGAASVCFAHRGSPFWFS